MNYSPLSNRVVAKMKKKGEKVSKGGIIITADVNDTPYDIVEVVAIGRGYVAQNGQLVSMETKVGDKVMLIKTTPFILPRDNNPELADNEDYVVFQESDIYVKVD